jgi:hypothetical protein
MKYLPGSCPKCGTDLVRNPRGGRLRAGADGCRRSGEDEMSRLSSLLRLFVEDRYVERLDGRPDKLRVEVIAADLSSGTLRPSMLNWVARGSPLEPPLTEHRAHRTSCSTNEQQRSRLWAETETFRRAGRA